MTERSIVLLRHAKAERPDGGPDIGRPLAARGRADAMAAGAWLAQEGLRPDVVICSPASRTRQTWQEAAQLMAGIDETGPQVRYEPVVYGGAASRLLRLLRTVDPAAGTVLLIGHNPTISELSVLLDPSDSGYGGYTAGGAGAGGPREMADGPGHGLRTAGLVVHRVGVEWSDLSPGSAPVLARRTARG